MGQQQILFIIVGVIIIGIAITVGISIVSAQTVATNRDAIINDLNHLASYAYQYRLRLRSMGGGQGDYTSFAIPPKMRVNEGGTYSVASAEINTLSLCAVSSVNESNTIQVLVGSEGKITEWTFRGDFE
jgi:ABC-type transport system involved in multi-copper enzyme maturation permease subunit